MNLKEKKIFDLDQPVEVTALSHDGRGVATINQKKTFIAGALAQEKVTLGKYHSHKNYIEAEVLDIIEPSMQRTAPLCPHFGICGGCNLQHLNVDAQIAFKQQALLEQLKHFGRVEPKQILAPLNALAVGYRRKARLGVKYVIKKEKLLIGFREKKSRYLADIDKCIVLHPHVSEKMPLLRKLISSLDAMSHIPQIEVAVGDYETALVIRHLQPLSEHDQELIIQFAQHHQFQIFLQPNAPLSITKLYPNDNNVFLSYTLPDEQLTFQFYPLDFTQVNLELNRLMVKQAIQLMNLTTDDTVLDLFCGIGNFTLPIAKHVKSVVGVEGSDVMVKRAYMNVQQNALTNVEFYAADLTQIQLQAPWFKKSYNKILLDPPRTGAKEILPLIKQLKAQLICYISCNPATLARDAGELVHEHGYNLQSVGVMNMFPHTAHTEAMAIFVKT